DEVDIWQFRERDSPRPIAHQRAHGYAVARKFTYNRGAVQAGSAGYQDHVHLPSQGSVAKSSRLLDARHPYGTSNARARSVRAAAGSPLVSRARQSIKPSGRITTAPLESIPNTVDQRF